MKKFFLFIFIIFSYRNLDAQFKFSAGLGAGVTASKPEHIQKDAFGKLTTDYGLNFYLPVQYRLGFTSKGKRFRTFFLESGLGYYCNGYRFTYDGYTTGYRNCHPYIPLKIRIEKIITNNIALTTGFGGVVDFFPIKISYTSGDSSANVTCEANLPGKRNIYTVVEFGIQKCGKSGAKHQLNFQFYCGLQTVATGIGYHDYLLGSSTVYHYRGSFLSLNYCYFFRKRNSFPNPTSLERIK
jgi:hypothetical protein